VRQAAQACVAGFARVCDSARCGMCHSNHGAPTPFSPVSDLWTQSRAQLSCTLLAARHSCIQAVL
jgi:cytochrome c553